MRKRFIAFTVMLGVVLLTKLGLPVLADMLTDSGIKQQYSSSETMMFGRQDAVRCVITKEKPQADPETPEDGSIEYTSTEKYIYTSGDAQAEITMSINGREATQEEWDDVKQWIDFSIASSGVSPLNRAADDLARDIFTAIISSQYKLSPENGQDSVFDRNVLSIDSIDVQSPYYATLKRGDRSDDVAKLQNRLITLGYLEGEADGQFGKITEQAVTLAQKELLEREMSVYAPVKTENTASVADTPTDAEDTAEATDAEDTTDGGDGETDGATVEEEPYVPETVVNGEAGQIFLIRLYSDEFPITVADLSKAGSGLIARFQKRIIELGYLSGSADGDYGPNTRRGVMLFQHYNNLEKTGVADEPTQKAAYSSQAKAAVNPILAKGSSSNGVERLQNLLIRFGFMRGEADGDYGNATVTGVEKLQAYLREKEIKVLTEKALRERGNYVSSDPASTPDTENSSDAQDVQPVPEVNPTMEITGVADPLLLDDIYAMSDDDWMPSAHKNGDEGTDVERIQRRLQHLEYLYTTPDGSFGNGTETALRAFQTRNGLDNDGVAGSQTLVKLFSTSARKALKPYMLKVSVDKQRVYAYAPDENEEYTKLVRTMTCSTGLSSSPTPRGTYQASTGPGARWHYFKKFTCWAQYAYYIQGDIMFHSVLYGSKGGSVTSSSVRNLGSRASHGCVRLSVEDAKWIYEHCPMNTKIIVY